MKIAGRPLDGLLVALLCLCAWKLSFGIDRVVDLSLADESGYLGAGLEGAVFDNGAQSGPLYALWYSALAKISADPIRLYHLNNRLLTVLTTSVVFVFLRMLGSGPLASLLVSFLFLIGPAGIYAYPKVNHFGLLPLFGCWALAGLFRFPGRWAAFVTLGFLIAAYCRPEYSVFLVFPAALLVGQLIHLTFFRKEVGRPAWKLWWPVLVLVVAAAAAFWELGFPVRGTRSWIAFGQHYSVHWVQWNGSNLNPWTKWESICANVFPGAQSLYQALLISPWQVIRHILMNLWLFPQTLFATLFRHVTVLVPGAHSAAVWGEAWAMAFAAAVILWRQRSYLQQLLRSAVQWDPEMRRAALAVAILPSVFVSLTIHPHGRYLLPLVVLLYGGFSLIVDRLLTVSPRQTVAIGLALFLAVPVVDASWVTGTTAPLGIRETVMAIRAAAPSNRRIKVLDFAGYATYAGLRFQTVSPLSKDAAWSEFAKSRDIGIVVVDFGLRDDERIASDAEFTQFLQDPRRFGFLRQPVSPTSTTEIYYRQDLVPARALAGMSP